MELMAQVSANLGIQTFLSLSFEYIYRLLGLTWIDRKETEDVELLKGFFKIDSENLANTPTYDELFLWASGSA